jgi:glutamyl-tRNA synthetase
MAGAGFFHCPLMKDDRGARLAKRHDALALRTLRQQGTSPAEVFQKFKDQHDHDY